MLCNSHQKLQSLKKASQTRIKRLENDQLMLEKKC